MGRGPGAAGHPWIRVDLVVLFPTLAEFARAAGAAGSRRRSALEIEDDVGARRGNGGAAGGKPARGGGRARPALHAALRRAGGASGCAGAAAGRSARPAARGGDRAGAPRATRRRRSGLERPRAVPVGGVARDAAAAARPCARAEEGGAVGGRGARGSPGARGAARSVSRARARRRGARSRAEEAGGVQSRDGAGGRAALLRGSGRRGDGAAPGHDTTGVREAMGGGASVVTRPDSMTPERWSRVEQLYARAQLLPADEWPLFLAGEAADDIELVDVVLQM